MLCAATGMFRLAGIWSYHQHSGYTAIEITKTEDRLRY